MPNDINIPDIPNSAVNVFEAWKSIANAENDVQLQKAIETAVMSCRSVFDTLPLKTLQESAKELQKKPDNEIVQAKFNEEFNKFLYGDAVRDGRYLGIAVHKSDVQSAKLLRKQMIIEFSSSCSTDMIVIDMAVTAYFRYLRISHLQVELASKTYYLEGKELQPQVNLLKQYDKQVESTYNQFLTSLTFLKELKQPKLNVKIHTKETYVAQNQQINKITNDFGK